jgi:hypothetical protein
MLLRQFFETCADAMEFVDLVQNGLKNHRIHRSLARNPEAGGLQMDWLRSEDLKEEKQ